ncbi:MAG: helicase-related protein [Syntrophaceticus schinkii]
MGKLLFQLYSAEGNGKKVLFLSSVPSFDRAFLKQKGYEFFDLVTPPLPLGTAARVYFELYKKYNHRQGVTDNLLAVESVRDHCSRLLHRLGLRDAYACKGDLAAADALPFPDREEMQEVEKLLKGRLLSMQEIFRFTGSVSREPLALSLQYLCLERRALLLPALYLVKGSLVYCQRCGWEGIPEPRSCARCGSKQCCSCPECGVLGNLCFCDQLYTAYDSSLVERDFLSAGFWRLLKGDGGTRGGHGRHGRQEIFCCPLVLGVSNEGLSVRADDNAVQAALSEDESRAEARKSFGTCPGSSFKLPTSDLRHPAFILPSAEEISAAGDKRRTAKYAKLLGEIRFTPSQESAADTLLKFGREGKPGGKCLVWAACGAGKTEVSFPLIDEVLRHGQEVLFATPRRDVVLEIAPRMAKAFGEGRVNALYGGSGGHGKDVPLVVATTHQTLRFYRRFDLVILDEGDAFPFPGSRMLHFGVEKARLFGGKLVYLTATPAPWMFARSSEVEVIKIPVRPHGFPLPVPEFLIVNPFKTSGKRLLINRRVLDITAELLKKPEARLFIFVPSVALTSQVGEALRSAAGKPPLEHLDAQGVEWTHASDRDRALKRERFFAGEFPVLVTTTIMERGVTVPRVHVLVLAAGQEGVFDAPTLVQIAGRCGRSPKYPTGEIWFISSGASRSMREARAQIIGLNREAMRRGYLREDWEKVLSRF